MAIHMAFPTTSITPGQVGGCLLRTLMQLASIEQGKVARLESRHSQTYFRF
jgi:hypothetical protein